MAQLYANNAKSFLASLVSDVATTLPLQTGEGALFPSPTGGDFFLVTLYEVVAQVEQNHEIVKCTARSGDSLTVVRAQESTTAQEWAADTPVELRITKGVMEALDGAITDGDFSSNGLMKRTAAGTYGAAVADTDYQSVLSEGAFVAGDKTKLDGIEAGADVTDTTNVTAAGALMDSEVDANLKTFVLPAGTTISAFGATLIDDADQATAQATLGLVPTESIIIACSDELSDLTVGTAKVTFRMPYAFTLTAVRATVTTAPTGTTVTVDINEGGASILSTLLTIDSSEKTSTTAATPAVISDSSLADDAEITIDVDQVGTTVAGTGLKVELIGYRT